MNYNRRGRKIYPKKGFQKFTVLNGDHKEIEEILANCKLEKTRDNYHNLNHIEYNETLVKKARELLLIHGYPVCLPDEDNETNTLNMEYHIYKSDNPDSDIRSSFDEYHEDDYGGVNFRVHTCIFYLEHTFKLGGELEVKKGDGNKVVIDPRRFNIALMSGVLFHRVLNCYGTGIRRCLVVQIRTEEDYYQEFLNKGDPLVQSLTEIHSKI